MIEKFLQLYRLKNKHKLTVPYILVTMILTGDRVEYLPEGGRTICVELFKPTENLCDD